MKVSIIAVLLLLQLATGYGLGWSPSASVQVTTPQKVSVSIGISSIDWGGVWGGDGGFLLRLEPGLSGGKLHAGFRSVFNFAFIPIVSADLCGSLMYTWNDPWGELGNDQTYLGAEFRATAVPLVLSSGIYRHVAGNDSDHDWIFSAGAGLGF